MTTEDLERLKRHVALDMARQSLEGADFSEGIERLTKEQREVYLWLEALFYDGEITYRELWWCCRRPRLDLNGNG